MYLSASRNFLCEECLKKGIDEAAVLVDHIKRIADGGNKLSWENYNHFVCNVMIRFI